MLLPPTRQSAIAFRVDQLQREFATDLDLDINYETWLWDSWPAADPQTVAVAWSYWMCSMLTALQEDAIGRLGELAACWKPGAALVVRNGPDEFAPRWVTLEWPEGVLAVVQGTTNWYQMVTYVLGALLSTPAGFLGKVNSHFYDTSRAIFQVMRSLFPQPGRPFTFCGHSYGAAVAVVMASLARKVSQATGGAFSFGAPMAGSSEWYLAQLPRINRWQNVDDPICELPPERGAFGVITAAASLLSGSLEAYTHFGNSVTLAPNGTMAHVDHPTGLAACLDFVFHLPTGLATNMDDHYIREYLNRLWRSPALRARSRLARGFANWDRIHALNGLG